MRLLTWRNLTQRERDIETEFGEPFALVLRGFAEMGYSKSETGRVLGWNKQDWLRRALPRHDPNQEIEWRAQHEGVR